MLFLCLDLCQTLKHKGKRNMYSALKEVTRPRKALTLYLVYLFDLFSVSPYSNTTSQPPSTSHNSHSLQYPGHSFSLNYLVNSYPSFNSQFSCEVSYFPLPKQKYLLPLFIHTTFKSVSVLLKCFLPLPDQDVYSHNVPGTMKERGNDRMAHRSQKLDFKTCYWV